MRVNFLLRRGREVVYTYTNLNFYYFNFQISGCLIYFLALLFDGFIKFVLYLSTHVKIIKI